MENITIYFDMDGVLSVFNDSVPMEKTFIEGYFYSVTPYENMVELINRLSEDLNVKILSCVYRDNHTINDKNKWRTKVGINEDIEAIYVPYGEDKKDYVSREGIKILLDDFTPNLRDWHKIPNFIGIKVFTETNTRKGYGSWHGLSIDVENDVNMTEKMLRGLISSLSIEVA